MAQQFDAGHLKLLGDPVRVVEAPVGKYLNSGLFSVSTNGTLVYRSPADPQSQLTCFDAQGNILKTVWSVGVYSGLDLSGDGTRALVLKQEPGDNTQALWLIDLLRDTPTALAHEPSTDYRAGILSPDGRRVIVGSVQPGHMTDIYEKPINGTGDAELLFQSDKEKFPLSWSPDGFLLFNVVGRGQELWVLPLKGHQNPVPLLHGGSDYSSEGRFSPDGRWVAYLSDESGHSEVYVRSFSPDGLGNGGVRVSANGGSSVTWGQDGKIYYIGLDRKLVAVKLTLGSVIQAGVPTELFQTPGTAYSPSPDGKRFLFLVPRAQKEMPLTVVLNWQAGLKK